MLCSACQHENPVGARFCSGCGAVVDGDPDVDPRIGQLIGGRYRVVRVIAEGGMGVVYEAEQRMGSSKRRVALKMLHPMLSRDQSLVARFHRECGTVVELEHPNTIRIYDFGSTRDGALYIAMEYVDGRPLSELLAEGPLSLDRAREVMRQVCGALHEAHEQGIVHRDLKPENILLADRAGERDFVKVLDFGIAARFDEQGDRTKLTQAGMVLGTPPYMSPEQFTGQRLDARSDVYSLGVIAYEMLTGRLPFSVETPWQWAHCHTTEAPAPLQSHPAGAQMPLPVVAAVMRALAKDPSARPESALALYEGMLDGEAAPGPISSDAVSAPATRASGTVPGAPAFSVQKTELARAATPLRTGAAVTAPIAPPAERRAGRGLVWGLGALAAALGAAALTLGLGSTEVEVPVSTNASGPSSVVLEPLADPDPNPAPAATTEPPKSEPEPPRTVKQTKPPSRVGKAQPPVAIEPPKPEPPKPEPPKADPPKPEPPAADPPKPEPPKSEPEPPKTEPPKPTLPTGDAACRAGVSAANARNIESAAALFHRCRATGGSPGELKRLTIAIRNKAPAAVRTHAFNGRCERAIAIASAASSVPGAGAPAQSQLGASQCKPKRIQLPGR